MTSPNLPPVSAPQRLYWEVQALHPYHKQVDMGAAIGVAGLEPYGTLGCWLEVRLKSNMKPHKVGLTNYHVIREACTSDLYTNENDESLRVVADREGMFPSDGRALRRVEQPPNQLVTLEINALETLSAAGHEVDPLLMERLIFLADKSSRDFGTAWAGSGHQGKTQNGFERDWGLVRPDPSAGRIGLNFIPIIELWRAFYPGLPDDMFPLPGVCGARVTATAKISELDPEDMREGCHIVYKLGASTGMTIGCLNPEPKVECIGRGESTVLGRAYRVTGIRGVHFGRLGDSGAVVFDRRGRLLGQINRVRLDKKETIIIPLEEIFQDIQDHSGGAVIDIRLPA